MALSGGALMLWGVRLPGFDLGFVAIGVLLLAIPSAALLIELLLRLVMLLFQKRLASPWFVGWPWWLSTFAIVGAILLLQRLDVPFRASFLISRPALERVVDQTRRGNRPRGAFWCGVFPFTHVLPADGGLKFTFNKDEFFWRRRGLYFSESGQPTATEPTERRVGKHWFLWHSSGW